MPRLQVAIIDLDKYSKEEFQEDFKNDKITAIWCFEKLDITKVSEVIDKEQDRQFEEKGEL